MAHDKRHQPSGQPDQPRQPQRPRQLNQAQRPQRPRQSQQPQQSREQSFTDWLYSEEGTDTGLKIILSHLRRQDDPTEYLRTGPHELTDEEKYKIRVSLPPRYQNLTDFNNIVDISTICLSDMAYQFQDAEQALADRDDPRCPDCHYFALSCRWGDDIEYHCSRCGYTRYALPDMEE